MTTLGAALIDGGPPNRSPTWSWRKRPAAALVGAAVAGAPGRPKNAETCPKTLGTCTAAAPEAGAAEGAVAALAVRGEGTATRATAWAARLRVRGETSSGEPVAAAAFAAGIGSLVGGRAVGRWRKETAVAARGRLVMPAGEGAVALRVLLDCR